MPVDYPKYPPAPPPFRPRASLPPELRRQIASAVGAQSTTLYSSYRCAFRFKDGVTWRLPFVVLDLQGEKPRVYAEPSNDPAMQEKAQEVLRAYLVLA